MSLAFEGSVQAGARRDAGTIQKMLDENAALIQTIVRYQRAGRVKDALRYQQLLHRNLLYLATLSDEAALKEELEMSNGMIYGTFARGPFLGRTAVEAGFEAELKTLIRSGRPLVQKHQIWFLKNYSTTRVSEN